MRLASLAPRTLVAVFAALTLVPLLLLAYFSVTRSTDAVRHEARARVSGTSSVAALVVEREMTALADLVGSYARRPTLVAAVAAGRAAAYDKETLRFHLRDIAANHDVQLAFVTDTRGTLVDIVPPTPSIVGRSYAFRDWYRGLTRTGRPYVSEAYVTQAASRARVVAASTYVRPRGGGEPTAILVAGYDLAQIQNFVDTFARSQGVRLTVTDQRGVVVATPGGTPRRLVSRRADPHVARALRGTPSMVETDGVLAAYAPVRELGWTVTATVPTETAFAGVRRLRAGVVAIAGILTLFLLAGLALLAHTLMQRARAERRLAERGEELEAASTELEHQNLELELQTTELEDKQAQLEAANDELEAQQGELQGAVAQLAEEKELVDVFYRFASALAVERELDVLADTILVSLADAADAEIAAIYIDDGEGSARLASSRGLGDSPARQPLRSREGLAGRALAERRLLVASHGETGLRVRVFGEDVAVQHEAHVPLVHGGRCLGVVSLARVGDREFTTRDREAISHLGEQAAIALANATSLRDARRLADVNRAVLDATIDGIAMSDRDGNVVLRNLALERLMGEIGLDGTGRLAERIDKWAARTTDPDGMRTALGRVLEAPERVIHHEFETQHGKSFELHSGPVHDAAGDAIGRIFVFREVTAERQAERLKSELVATVSHELRTPLTGVLGFAELLTQRELDPETQQRYVRTIYDEARRLTNLVNDFLDVQRIEAGHFTLSIEPFELTQLLRHEAELFSAQSTLHRIELDVPDEHVAVVGERERIAQVIANLLSNAIKYSPEGGLVEVQAEQRGTVVRVSVGDSGLGIPAAQQAQIFNKFFRVDSSDTRRIGGTGLGLALCREIVQAHGGRIGFDSVEGQGSTFWFELPAVDARVARRPRLFLVGHDAEAGDRITRLLDEDGYDVERIGDPEEALARAAHEPPDVICLSLAGGGDADGDAWATLVRLKESPATRNVPIVVCAAGNGHGEAAALGAADVLAKPFTGKQLSAAVERLLPGHTGSVLVVDDDDRVRRLVVQSLERDGYELREAADGEEALAAIAASRPDVMVLDLAMPKLDGFSVLERLHEDCSTAALPVLVLTGRRLSASERRRLLARAAAVLDKNAYSASRLRDLVRQALGARAPVA